MRRASVGASIRARVSGRTGGRADLAAEDEVADAGGGGAGLYAVLGRADGVSEASLWRMACASFSGEEGGGTEEKREGRIGGIGTNCTVRKFAGASNMGRGCTDLNASGSTTSDVFGGPALQYRDRSLK
jgi:hypothetical protein